MSDGALTATVIDWMYPVTHAQYWRRGWGTYEVSCPVCNHKWIAVAPVGTRCASVCSVCHHVEEMNWLDGSGNMPGNDGVWL